MELLSRLFEKLHPDILLARMYKMAIMGSIGPYLKEELDLDQFKAKSSDGTVVIHNLALNEEVLNKQLQSSPYPLAEEWFPPYLPLAWQRACMLRLLKEYRGQGLCSVFYEILYLRPAFELPEFPRLMTKRRRKTRRRTTKRRKTRQRRNLRGHLLRSLHRYGYPVLWL